MSVFPEVYVRCSTMELQREASVKSEIDERSNTPDSVIMDNSQLMEDLASDYSKYMSFDLTREHGKFSESIEDMLTKLDEFCGLVDMIRSDTTLCLNKTVPDIHGKCTEMEVIFEKIDKLEAFVGVVKQSVGKMEESVSKAEDDFGSLGGFMKKISSIVSPKRSQDPDRRSKQAGFVQPETFNTSDYLGVVAVKPATPSVEAATSTAEAGNT
ncbi:biogenesis of lysosome-related organelles complex 1 subunit 4-like [Haliotis rufescens]|uniref:biogenesis of lysosome-related organelles complex 1 subunit 4-like n=1 Tax=Haliotis rufescens TaxID=6454 RepID=UPI00201E83AE|nr:biogenesis of lysosome-related organelles complex 1 subunit 4-like [Haliotis rufescens]